MRNVKKKRKTNGFEKIFSWWMQWKWHPSHIFRQHKFEGCQRHYTYMFSHTGDVYVSSRRRRSKKNWMWIQHVRTEPNNVCDYKGALTQEPLIFCRLQVNVIISLSINLFAASAYLSVASPLLLLCVFFRINRFIDFTCWTRQNIA